MPLFFFTVVGYFEAFFCAESVQVSWLFDLGWAATFGVLPLSVVLNLMPDKIASFPF